MQTGRPSKLARLVGNLMLVAATTSGGACASTGNYEEILATWVGSDINPLISAWGRPSDVFDMPDGRSKLYTWHCQLEAAPARLGG